jgi:ArsR family transcriptional regulator, lead/cadmium/zinc/bismuth-responsive transcriptional repressor
MTQSALNQLERNQLEPETLKCCIHPEAVARASAALPKTDTLERAVQLLKAVADPTRLKLLLALSSGELCVGDLAATIGQSESATSHQLRLLREARLVASRKEGRVNYYSLEDLHVTQLIEAALEHAREGV